MRKTFLFLALGLLVAISANAKTIDLSTYDEVQQISGTAQLEAYKNIDGEAATVSGFKFKMAIFDGLNWRDLQTVTNSEDSPHDIIFDAVTFGGDKNYSGPGLYQYVDLKNVGDSKEFKFVIDETEGTTDSEGNAYIADEANYFAKVTVTLMLKNEFSKNTYYKVSKPLYYKGLLLSDRSFFGPYSLTFSLFTPAVRRRDGNNHFNHFLW